VFYFRARFKSREVYLIHQKMWQENGPELYGEAADLLAYCMLCELHRLTNVTSYTIVEVFVVATV
jgi:hypothetical protein